MSYEGDIRLGDTIDIKFTTRRFSTGVPFTLAGTPAISAYVGNSTTEITSGITLTVDLDSRTGLNNIRVVASGGNGFAAQTNVSLVITAGTVDGVSVVGECVGSFSIENRSALVPVTANRQIAVDASNQVSVGTLAANVITAASIAADAITAAKVADGTIDAATFAAGAIDAAAIAADAITAAKIADGAIDAATFAAGAINAAAIAADAITAAKIAAGALTAAKFAAGAIDAAALASDAVDEIWNKAVSDLGAVPAANAAVISAISFLFMALRNLRTQTSTANTIANDAGATIATASTSDDGTTNTKSEYA